MLVAIGASHHSVGLDELAALTPHASSIHTSLIAHPSIHGALVLSTCNRFEVYLDAIEFHPAIEAAVAAVQELAGLADAAKELQVLVGEAAVAHALSVTCGLDSMVVGEAEISGQVRAALAAYDSSLTPTLRRLFEHALSTSKTVASRTALGAAGRSVASVGLDLVEERHGSIDARRVLVLGTGAYARVVVAELGRRGATDLWVHSASGRAQQFARTHPVQPVPSDGLLDALTRAELVVACSGGTEPALTEPLLAEARFGALVAVPVLDLTLGGDVSPDAACLPGVDLIDLETIGEHAPTETAAAVLAARDIVDRSVQAYLHLEGGRAADPAVVAMRSYVMTVIEQELEQIERRYPNEVATVVARSLRRVSGALLHGPSLRAQEVARTGEIDDYHRAMRTLFGIEIETT